MTPRERMRTALRHQEPDRILSLGVTGTNPPWAASSRRSILHPGQFVAQTTKRVHPEAVVAADRHCGTGIQYRPYGARRQGLGKEAAVLFRNVGGYPRNPGLHGTVWFWTRPWAPMATLVTWHPPSAAG